MDKRNERQRPRRRPGAAAKPQKAPHLRPRKHAPVQPETAHTAPDVVYLAPKPFNRNRLVLRLLTVIAVVMALVLGLSIFFKVEHIEVSGCSQYSAWEIQQASGIEVGDQLLTFSVPRAAWRITDTLRYVKTARIGIRLPDTVLIEIVETQVAYALQDQDGAWWLMASDGKILDPCAEGKQNEHTVVTGVSLKDPVAGQQGVANETRQSATDPDGSIIPVTVTAAQQLSTLQQLAQLLEKSGFLGTVASIDVTNLYEIRLWYEDKFDVMMGDTANLSLKVQYLQSFVRDYTQNKPYEQGVLDLTDPEWIEYDSKVPTEE